MPRLTLEFGENCPEKRKFMLKLEKKRRGSPVKMGEES